MRGKLIAVALVIVALAVSAAPGSAITNGQPDGDGHPYVGLILNDESFCSGTLLTPTTFLTAAHCTVAFDGTPTFITFDPEPLGDVATFYEVESVLTHPLFCNPCGSGLPGFDAYDVGLAFLAEPVEMSTYGQLPGENTAGGLKGTQLTSVGYGVQAFAVGGGPPRPSAFASRFFATSTVIGINNRVGDLFLKLSANGSQGKGGTCFGDSGGPNFYPDQVTIAGVNSFVTNGRCNGVTYSQRTDVPEVLNFIQDNLV